MNNRNLRNITYRPAMRPKRPTWVDAVIGLAIVGLVLALAVVGYNMKGIS